jgi:cobyrinic acid a,c-diamide synthase
LTARGVIFAAPASGSGKTVLVAALLRLLSRRGLRVASAKLGPDYIDPAFHAAASRRACLNIDLWAMRPQTVAAVLHQLTREAELVVTEGVMGLFDGAADGSASTADFAQLSGWPVILVVDARGQADSAGALIRGFASHRPGLGIAGVIFNRVGGPNHGDMLRRGVAPLGIPVLGCLPRHDDFALSERHLGLVQAIEHSEIDRFLDRAADRLEACIDVAMLLSLVGEGNLPSAPTSGSGVPPLGQRIAVARDIAFSFVYPALLDAWRSAKAEVRLFSPLADEAPPADADAVYLPGGYPELHAGRLAGNANFRAGLRRATVHGATIFGECGGYMTLGRGLIDQTGSRHEMAGLLPLESSFAERRLHLGYRQASVVSDGPLGRAGALYRGHEFHYAAVIDEGPGDALFDCRDARGVNLGASGRVQGRVLGSFLHLIDRGAPASASPG